MMKSRDVDYSTRDYEGFRTDMIRGLQEKIPEYTDLSQTDAGVVLIELLSSGLDILSYYIDKTANEVYIDTAKERENIILRAEMLGYVFNDGRPSEFDQVFEIIPQASTFTIPKGYVLKTTENSVEQAVIFELSEDLVIPPNCEGTEQDEEGNYLYSVPIIQGYTKSNEILGTSSEAPNQQFYLADYPVIKDSISLWITEATGNTEEWTRVDTFLNSKSTDNHFVLNIDAENRGIITFGNGKSGRIPTMYHDGIIANYRIGGGEQGNVSAYTINQVEQKLSGIVKTFNPSKARILGVDKESDESIRIKSKSEFKSTWGAIALEDYHELAKTFMEVLDATSDTGATKFDVIVNVLPKDYSNMTQEDLLALKHSLMEVFRVRRVLGVDVYIEFAEVLKITPNITCVLHPNMLKKDIEYLVDCIIKSSFQGDVRALGENIHPSEIISEIMQLDGVKSVNCDIPNLPSEVTKSQVMYVGDYNLTLVGGA